jgi:hypothetical protein
MALFRILTDAVEVCLNSSVASNIGRVFADEDIK